MFNCVCVLERCFMHIRRSVFHFIRYFIFMNTVKGSVVRTCKASCICSIKYRCNISQLSVDLVQNTSG